MSPRPFGVANARLGIAKSTQRYQPLPDFTEVAPNVFVPRGYVPGPYELVTPVVRTEHDAAREYLACAQSLPYFLFHFGWSLHVDDPDGPQYRKIPAYPYLLEFAHEVQTPRNTHIEKSRQMLLSWAWMGVFLWDILFHDGWSNLAISRLEKLVDDGGDAATPDSLFGKLLVIWKGLPPYLQHDLEFTKLKVRCPLTNSHITGQSGAGAGGRGPTYNRALWDEAAFSQHSHALFTGLQQAAKSGLCLNSTPMGKANEFARIRFQKHTTFRRMSFLWIRHPELAKGLYCECGWHADETSGDLNEDQFHAHTCLPPNDPLNPPRRHPRSPAYDRLSANYTPDQIGSELDLSYERSQRGRVYDAFDATDPVLVWDHEEHVGAIRAHETEAAYRRRYLVKALLPGRPCVVGIDPGVGDPAAVVLGQILDERAMKIRWLDDYEKADAGWRHMHAFICGAWMDVVKQVTGLDLIYYGDPYGKARDSDLKSWFTNLGNADPPITVIYEPHLGTKLEWLDFIADLIRRRQFQCSRYAAGLMDVLGQYHFPLDGNGVPIPGKHEPVHDAFSHKADAMRYPYQFRWASRLLRVDQKPNEVGKILRVGQGGRTGRKEF